MDHTFPEGTLRIHPSPVGTPGWEGVADVLPDQEGSGTFFDLSDEEPLFLARKHWHDGSADSVYPEARLAEWWDVLEPDLRSLRGLVHNNLDSIWWGDGAEDPTGLWGVYRFEPQGTGMCSQRMRIRVYEVSRPGDGWLFAIPSNQFYVAKRYTWTLEDYTPRVETVSNSS